MRRPFIAGNWKMNLDRASAVALAQGVAREAEGVRDVDLAVCPPSVYIDAVGRAIAGSKVALGAQNAYHEPKGAYTGEISAPMLCDLGCRYVILGHSERRHILGESSEDVNQKVHAALEAGLRPIVCLGETLAQREGGQTLAVIRRQFDGSLSGLSGEQMDQVVIAYEPVWAIGTGKVATPEQAEEVHKLIRRLVSELYDGATADAMRVQYGGSVKPNNVEALMAEPDIDGALVGGASLEADLFAAIVKGTVAGQDGGERS